MDTKKKRTEEMLNWLALERGTMKDIRNRMVKCFSPIIRHNEIMKTLLEGKAEWKAQVDDKNEFG